MGVICLPLNSDVRSMVRLPESGWDPSRPSDVLDLSKTSSAAATVLVDRQQFLSRIRRTTTMPSSSTAESENAKANVAKLRKGDPCVEVQGMGPPVSPPTEAVNGQQDKSIQGHAGTADDKLAVEENNTVRPTTGSSSPNGVKRQRSNGSATKPSVQSKKVKVYQYVAPMGSQSETPTPVVLQAGKIIIVAGIPSASCQPQAVAGNFTQPEAATQSSTQSSTSGSNNNPQKRVHFAQLPQRAQGLTSIGGWGLLLQQQHPQQSVNTNGTAATLQHTNIGQLGLLLQQQHPQQSVNTNGAAATLQQQSHVVTNSGTARTLQQQQPQLKQVMGPVTLVPTAATPRQTAATPRQIYLKNPSQVLPPLQCNNQVPDLLKETEELKAINSHLKQRVTNYQNLFKNKRLLKRVVDVVFRNETLVH